ncbi:MULTISPECIES: DUF1481 domain-containing protein [unclassified Brenneria]|uniref:DUF1481 domain-containing protein n=1 Tax=unclassified Brenneria TaxID=2634434 RepID=UPI0018F0CCF0|nr:DUF1481 domain-containing protein [Brenneria sp. L3-3C-1]MBJ7224078.1 DUF1481 domain-containing protein [Brenneria sp. L3-3C-1]MEE3645324.1 DUF1481 domain-containing protein [Brenneria sp. L3_3C_1]
MAVKSLSRGAFSPLLLLSRWFGIGAAIALIVACSSHTPPPPVLASGYISDHGVVRLWRKDDSQHDTVRLLVVYNPIQGNHSVVTQYLYQQGNVREIERKLETQKDETQIRFAEDGTASFMQRQLAERRESISDDDLALYQWDAKRLLELSDVLKAGKVTLQQGIWQNGQVITCDGARVQPDFDNASREWIAQRRQQLAGLSSLSIAWLEAPEGTQLLLVDQGDFCRWQSDADRL